MELNKWQLSSGKKFEKWKSKLSKTFHHSLMLMVKQRFKDALKAFAGKAFNASFGFFSFA